MTTARPLWTLQAHGSYVTGIHFEQGDVVTRGFRGDIARWAWPDSPKVIDAATGRGLARGIVEQ